MLCYISVKNFAIIENIEVDFSSGMTALTGETGAGKSLLIDAIGLLLGDRASSNIVRTGSDKALVEGMFKYSNPKISAVLKQYEIYDESEELIIKRQITSSNNNIIKINNHSVTLSQLREITGLLADIHTQFDTHRLINQDTYLDIIDGFEIEQMDILLNEYQESLIVYKNDLKELKRLQESNNNLMDRLDLIRFQKNEIESYNLSNEEEDDLENEVEKMQNFDKIYKSLNESKLLFENGSLDHIYNASKLIEDVKEYSEEYGEYAKRISEAYFELVDIEDSLQDELKKLDFDPAILDSHQERLNDLNALKRKYRKTIPEIIEYYESISKDIDNIDNYDEVISLQQSVVSDSHKLVQKKALEITKIRKITAGYIEKELLQILHELELKNTIFKVEFTSTLDDDYTHSSVFMPNGVDEIDFLISTNIGEPLKPLSKSASGGEMSRIMLGLKNLLVKSLHLSLIIFDEIDSGVSGYVANQVAKRMKNISKETQVICITHIPQVAALSDHHLYISKSVESERTKANIKLLLGDEKVFEIASMISGDNVSEASLLSAKELLK
jgi:DNA repair protein RecN (Recombination protein N)